uniref:Uncharacterized protein n=1 Tax=Salvator merianae TaxID=96440 RepID=A0A8D0C183_SALMN
MPVIVRPYGQLQPRVKMGGLCWYGSRCTVWHIFLPQDWHERETTMGSTGRTMMQSGITFGHGTFMAIGIGIYC